MRRGGARVTLFEACWSDNPARSGNRAFKIGFVSVRGGESGVDWFANGFSRLRPFLSWILVGKRWVDRLEENTHTVVVVIV